MINFNFLTFFRLIPFFDICARKLQRSSRKAFSKKKPKIFSSRFLLPKLMFFKLKKISFMNTLNNRDPCGIAVITFFKIPSALFIMQLWK